MLSHKGNTDQNITEIPFYHSQNGNHQENKTRNADEYGAEPLYIVGGM
jgi:hypothetical protein